MGARTYDNFDLLIEPVPAPGASSGSPATYSARVTSSPVGEGATLTFRLPMDDQTLSLLLTRFDPGRSGIRRGPTSPQTQAGTQLGTALFSAVFDGAVGREWVRSLDRVTGVAGATDVEGGPPARRGGLRLRLRLDAAPQIAGLPWELLRDPSAGGSWLAQSELTPVVRTLSASEPLPPLALDGPLRVLVVISSPTDLTELDVEGEWARMQEALAGPVVAGTVVLDRLPEPTTTALGTWLRRRDVHVLHFIGHGESVSGEGVLYFCDADGRSVPADAGVLGPLVHDHDPLRLVVLNACRSAMGDTTDPYAGMAQGLGVQGAAAVVAMQFPISDRAALAFTSGLYGALSDGLPVDQALTCTRKLMLGDFGSEWATPVLFLRGEDGQVFDSAPTATPGRDATAPAAPPAPSLPARPPPLRRALLAGLGVLALVLAVVGVVVTRAQRSGSEPAAGGATTSASASIPSRAASTPGTGTSPIPSPTPSTSSPTGSGLVTASPGARAVAHRLAAPPSVDGVGSEWVGQPVYVSDQVVYSASSGQPSPVARWQLAWDEGHVEVYVVVTDGTVTTADPARPEAAWKGDSVSFEIGRWLDRVPTAVLDSGDSHVIVAPLPGDRAVLARNVPRGGSLVAGPPLTGVDYRVVTRPDGYTVEASFPWASLGLSPPRAGSRLALNLDVSDAVASGPHRGQLAALVSTNPHRISNDATSRARWGELTLAE